MVRPRILFAPGAGAPSTSAWMAAWAERLAALGPVTRFDYPYMEQGRRRPDVAKALIAAHRAALAEVRAQGGGPLVLAGKSMGSRMGCHVAQGPAAQSARPIGTGSPGPSSSDLSIAPDVAALVCFGYPLRSASSGALRDAVLLALRTPILFLQGTRDELCPLVDLAAVRAKMTAPNELYVVEGGDHSLLVTAKERKARGESQADVDARILAAVAAFLEKCAKT